MDDAAEIKTPKGKQEVSDEVKILGYKTRKALLAQRFEEFRFRTAIAVVYMIALSLLGYAYAFLTHNTSSEKSVPFTIIGGIMGVAGYSFFVFFARLNIQNSLRWIEFRLAQLGIEELNDNIKDDFFTKLVQINFKYIDQYYLQTQEQAAKSFKLAVFASASGLIVLITGIVLMYIDPSRISSGIITASAGILSQFISAVFFYFYNQTIVKMSQYHQKLVITQNISIALKISNELDADAKKRAMELLVDRLTSDVNKFLTTEK